MPQNAGYYYAAYVVVALLYGGYAIRLWRQARALRRADRRLP